jgi:hypothetical protein
VFIVKCVLCVVVEGREERGKTCVHMREEREERREEKREDKREGKREERR